MHEHSAYHPVPSLHFIVQPRTPKESPRAPDLICNARHLKNQKNTERRNMRNRAQSIANRNTHLHNSAPIHPQQRKLVPNPILTRSDRANVPIFTSSTSITTPTPPPQRATFRPPPVHTIPTPNQKKKPSKKPLQHHKILSQPRHRNCRRMPVTAPMHSPSAPTQPRRITRHRDRHSKLVHLPLTTSSPSSPRHRHRHRPQTE